MLDTRKAWQQQHPDHQTHYFNDQFAGECNMLYRQYEERNIGKVMA